MIAQNPVNFLPGKIEISAGNASNYRTLQRFHYLPTCPATWASVAAAWYHHPEAGRPAKLVGVGVLSWPTALHRGRNRAFDLNGLRFGDRIRWANDHIRTISRVVVHPQFRSIGLSHRLIDWLCNCCETTYVEASARMGRAHPLFDRAGFHRIDPQDDRQPIYYWRLTKNERTNPISDASAVKDEG